MRILALSGSLRARSYNTALARAATALAPEGIEVELYESLAEIPPYNADVDNEDVPGAVRDLRARIEAADALLFVTPEYNGSISGVLKNAIDWASRPAGPDASLWGKTAVIAGVTTGRYGAIWAQQDLRRVLGLAGARVAEGELPVAHADNVFDDEGQLRDPLVAQRLRSRLERLASETPAARIAA
jgi:chromate reductase